MDSNEFQISVPKGATLTVAGVATGVIFSTLHDLFGHKIICTYKGERLENDFYQIFMELLFSVAEVDCDNPDIAAKMKDHAESVQIFPTHLLEVVSELRTLGNQDELQRHVLIEGLYVVLYFLCCIFHSEGPDLVKEGTFSDQEIIKVQRAFRVSDYVKLAPRSFKQWLCCSQRDILGALCCNKVKLVTVAMQKHQPLLRQVANAWGKSIILTENYPTLGYCLSGFLSEYAQCK